VHAEQLSYPAHEYRFIGHADVLIAQHQLFAAKTISL